MVVGLRDSANFIDESEAAHFRLFIMAKFLQ
jgi:hypothetical protein